MTDQTAYHHGNLREELVTAALEMIQENGGAYGVTLRKIASRVGVSHAAPYRHFQDKKDLLAAVARQGFDLLMDWTRKRLSETDGEPLSRFGAWGMAYMDFAIAHPAHFRVMFAPPEKGMTLSEDLRPESSHYFKEFQELVSDCHDKGVLVGEDPASITRAAWSMVHGFSTLFIGNHMETTGLDLQAVTHMKRSILMTFYRGTRPDGEGLSYKAAAGKKESEKESP